MVKTTYADLCGHCLGDKKVRNPTGKCDHLYYPDNCRVCKRAARKPVVKSELFFTKRQTWRLVYNDNLLPLDYGDRLANLHELLEQRLADRAGFGINGWEGRKS